MAYSQKGGYADSQRKGKQVREKGTKPNEIRSNLSKNSPANERKLAENIDTDKHTCVYVSKSKGVFDICFHNWYHYHFASTPFKVPSKSIMPVC